MGPKANSIYTIGAGSLHKLPKCLNNSLSHMHKEKNKCSNRVQLFLKKYFSIYNVEGLTIFCRRRKGFGYTYATQVCHLGKEGPQHGKLVPTSSKETQSALSKCHMRNQFWQSQKKKKGHHMHYLMHIYHPRRSSPGRRTNQRSDR